jgi:hypothetical protein
VFNSCKLINLNKKGMKIIPQYSTSLRLLLAFYFGFLFCHGAVLTPAP